MEQSCGAEDYAWTAEATTVQFIREIVGFKEYFDLSAANAFFLRPSLPSVVPHKEYIVRGLNFRGTRFDVEYRVDANNTLHLTIVGTQSVTVQVRNNIDTVLVNSSTWSAYLL